MSTSALTIGNFDGVHLGHLARISAMKKLGRTVVLTFKNHTSAILSSHPACLITTLEHKLLLLKQAGVDQIILEEFSREFAKQTYHAFLTMLFHQLKFTHLVLSQGEAIGKDRQGDETHVKALGKQLGFHTHYLSKLDYANQPISSGRIRQAIAEGNLELTAALLGRPYSLYGKCDKNSFDLNGLCTPPDGNYAIRVEDQLGIASLHNKTLHTNLSLPTSPCEIFFLEKIS